MFDMTCQEFRSRMEATGGLTKSDVIAHVETCAACRAFSYAHEDLIRSLRTVRAAVPGVPESLDAAVMSAFRRETAQAKVAAIRQQRFQQRIVWGALAAMLLIGAVVAIARRKPETPSHPLVVRSV